MNWRMAIFIVFGVALLIALGFTLMPQGPTLTLPPAVNPPETRATLLRPSETILARRRGTRLKRRRRSPSRRRSPQSRERPSRRGTRLEAHPAPASLASADLSANPSGGPCRLTEVIPLRFDEDREGSCHAPVDVCLSCSWPVLGPGAEPGCRPTAGAEPACRGDGAAAAATKPT